MWATKDSAPSCRMLTCASRSERMRGRNHENQFVEVNDDGMQLRLLRIVSEHAQFDSCDAARRRECGCPASAAP